MSHRQLPVNVAVKMTQMGQDVQDKLGFKPKQFYRERHVYP